MNGDVGNGDSNADGDSDGDGMVEIIAGWHPGGYPDLYACDSAMLDCNERVAGPLARRECMITGEEAFCFAFRTDNTGPPRSAAEVVRGFAVAQTQFPMAQVIAGSLDDFFAAAQDDASLPVIEGEIGDVWIPGVASDPWKARTTRRMQRAWSDYVHTQEQQEQPKQQGQRKQGGGAEMKEVTGGGAPEETGEEAGEEEPWVQSIEKAGVYLLKLTEHTWGLSDLRNKSKNWTNAELEVQLAAGDFDVNIKVRGGRGWRRGGSAII